MAVRKNEAVSSLCRKGYAGSHRRGKDHLYLDYLVDGVPAFFTFVSHGGPKDLSDKRISDMAKECHLSNQQFKDLAKCKMSKEQYRQILIDKGIIKGD
jgi:hypothetical protein